MNYVFVGMMIPDEYYKIVHKNSKDSMQDAANVLQWHLYNGLCKNLNCSIDIISSLPIHSWPKYYNECYIKERTFKTVYSDKNKCIGFINIKGIRKKSIANNLYNSLKEWCNSNKGEKTIFVYTLSSTHLEAINRIKNQFDDIKVCAIVADLPTMTNLSVNQSFLIKIYKKMTRNGYEKYGSCIDCYVLLTKYMADYLKLEKSYCVMEGISTSQLYFGDEINNNNSSTKVILYSGTLHRKFGITNLLEAFKAIPYNNYQLKICGVGDSEDEIKKNSVIDNRIIFLGQVSRDEVLQLQKEATIVVNPRQNTEEFCKYSFPSKNLEYMSSGTPLVAYKLDGIPDEYDEYIYYVNDNSIYTLSQRLIEVCEYSYDELKSFGSKARQFVQENKNELVQTKKIIDLIMKQ